MTYSARFKDLFEDILRETLIPDCDEQEGEEYVETAEESLSKINNLARVGGDLARKLEQAIKAFSQEDV